MSLSDEASNLDIDAIIRSAKASMANFDANAILRGAQLTVVGGMFFLSFYIRVSLSFVQQIGPFKTLASSNMNIIDKPPSQCVLALLSAFWLLLR